MSAESIDFGALNQVEVASSIANVDRIDLIELCKNTIANAHEYHPGSYFSTTIEELESIQAMLELSESGSALEDTLNLSGSRADVRALLGFLNLLYCHYAIKSPFQIFQKELEAVVSAVEKPFSFDMDTVRKETELELGLGVTSD